MAPDDNACGQARVLDGKADQRRGLEHFCFKNLGFAVANGVSGADAAAAHVQEHTGDRRLARVDHHVDVERTEKCSIGVVVDQSQRLQVAGTRLASRAAMMLTSSSLVTQTMASAVREIGLVVDFGLARIAVQHHLIGQLVRNHDACAVRH